MPDIRIATEMVVSTKIAFVVASSSRINGWKRVLTETPGLGAPGKGRDATRNGGKQRKRQSGEV